MDNNERINKKDINRKNSSIKIIIATHKQYKMPKDNIYMPVQGGAEKSKNIKGYQPDNEGENISDKNNYYCELTALYWAWKNLKDDYIGLVHYRRYLTNEKKIPKEEEKKFDYVLTEKQIKEKMKNADIILPKKRKYYIETLYNHYKHTLYVEPLDETRKIIEKKYPSYLKEFDKLKKRTSAHMFNIFIMKKELLNDYCIWLFDILFELEKNANIEKYDAFHARFFGRISELLLDVWIYTNNLKYEEVNMIDIPKVNWIEKGTAFLKAKFIGKKYRRSF